MTQMKGSISARISSYSKHNSKKRERDRKRKYRAKQKDLKIKKQGLVISKLLDHQRELNEKNIIQDIIISDFKEKEIDFKEKEYSFTRYIKTNEISSNKKRKHVSGVAERIENVINNSYKGCGNKRKAEELIKLCGYGKIYGDTGKNIIDDFALKAGKKTFPAWKVLKEIDLHNRSANFSTVELLRKVEGVKVYGRGMFTSSSTLSNRCKELETYASTIIPFKEFTSVGKNLNIIFDYEKILTVALQSLGLYEKASKDGVEIAFTLDYAQICKRRGHVLAGIKIVDKDARHPSSKELLF